MVGIYEDELEKFLSQEENKLFSNVFVFRLMADSIC